MDALTRTLDHSHYEVQKASEYFILVKVVFLNWIILSTQSLFSWPGHNNNIHCTVKHRYSCTWFRHGCIDVDPGSQLLRSTHEAANISYLRSFWILSLQMRTNYVDKLRILKIPNIWGDVGTSAEQELWSVEALPCKITALGSLCKIRCKITPWDSLFFGTAWDSHHLNQICSLATTTPCLCSPPPHGWSTRRTELKSPLKSSGN